MLFKRAKVYLHTRRNENYGLSVAEAIGYGCIPVVPKSGGPWIDIVEQGKYGYGYDTVNEATDIIQEAFKTPSNNYREIYDSRHRFSFKRFKNELETLTSQFLM